MEQSRALIPVDTSEDRVIDLWLMGRPDHTKRAYRNDIALFRAFIGKPFNEVKFEDASDFVENLQGRAANTRKRIVSVVKSFYAFCLLTGFLQVNVFNLIKISKGSETLSQRIMDEQQVHRMIEREDNPRNYAILHLLYSGGLRVSELCNLKWSDLHERNDSGLIDVTGKGDKTRHILLNIATWNMLMGMRHSGEYVFESRQSSKKNGKRLTESQVRNIVKKSAIKAGISVVTNDVSGKSNSKVSPHWLRHAHASHALDRGAPISLVKETLGHQSVETTGGYTHARPNSSSSQFLAM